MRKYWQATECSTDYTPLSKSLIREIFSKVSLSTAGQNLPILFLPLLRMHNKEKAREEEV